MTSLKGAIEGLYEDLSLLFPEDQSIVFKALKKCLAFSRAVADLAQPMYAYM